MNEAIGKEEVRTVQSELELSVWSVVSFDACEASSLTYSEAVHLMAEKEAAGVYGLCIITDAAAIRLKGPETGI